MLTQEASDYSIKEIVTPADGSNTRLANVLNDGLTQGKMKVAI
jgi:hypothetical protein